MQISFLCFLIFFMSVGIFSPLTRGSLLVTRLYINNNETSILTIEYQWLWHFLFCNFILNHLVSTNFFFNHKWKIWEKNSSKFRKEFFVLKKYKYILHLSGLLMVCICFININIWYLKFLVKFIIYPLF